MTIIYNPDNYTITDVIKNLYPDIKKEYLRWNWLFKKIRYRNWTWKNIDLEERGRVILAFDVLISELEKYKKN